MCVFIGNPQQHNINTADIQRNRGGMEECGCNSFVSVVEVRFGRFWRVDVTRQRVTTEGYLGPGERR